MAVEQARGKGANPLQPGPQVPTHRDASTLHNQSRIGRTVQMRGAARRCRA